MLFGDAGRRRLVAAPLSIAVATFLGCGRNDLELGAVQGTVTMDGKPLPNATIRFVPIGGGRSALGRTDENGHYEMLYSATAKGALVGPVRVEITVAEEVETPRGNPIMTPELVPRRYNERSELTAEVKPEGCVLDFHLESQ